MALLWNPKASGYFRKSKPETMRPEQQEWRVRAALLQEDWPLVLSSTQELNAELRDTPSWAYWRGRALATLGRTVEARQEWLKISRPAKNWVPR
jgi:soluble lytic murein transglycosylase